MDMFLVSTFLILTEISLHSQAALNIVFDQLKLPNVKCDYGEIPLCAAIVMCCNAMYVLLLCVMICWHLRHGYMALKICGERFYFSCRSQILIVSDFFRVHIFETHALFLKYTTASNEWVYTISVMMSHDKFSFPPMSNCFKLKLHSPCSNWVFIISGRLSSADYVKAWIGHGLWMTVKISAELLFCCCHFSCKESCNACELY